MTTTPNQTSDLTEVETDLEVWESYEQRQGALDMEPSYFGEEDEDVVLLDPLVAYQQEAVRMQQAGPRRRITADDLDRIQGGRS